MASLPFKVTKLSLDLGAVPGFSPLNKCFFWPPGEVTKCYKDEVKVFSKSEFGIGLQDVHAKLVTQKILNLGYSCAHL
jgi:hypothetical protein